MYLVHDHPFGTTFLAFTWRDPTEDGYKGSFESGVSLDYDLESVHSWTEGQARPEVCAGRSPTDPKHYKVFKHRKDIDAAGYQYVPGDIVVFESWARYLKVRLAPPDPAQTPAPDWYDYLDKVDSRKSPPLRLSKPNGDDRDEVAAWLAETHFIADNGIREVWYLPKGAPANEIRLLELSDRIPGNESTVESIDFGLNLERANFRLAVADVTSNQLEMVKRDPSRLPAGWSLDDRKIWGRRRA